MNRNHIDTDSLLDRVAGAIRDESVDQSVVDAAASRVRATLSTGAAPVASAAAEPDHIRTCADVEALIPSYLGGRLSEARTLLFEDHMGECVPCRKALKAARAGERPAARAFTSKTTTRVARRTVPVRWAIAAALVVAFGILPVGRYLNPFGGSLEAVVEAAEGPVYRVENEATRRLDVGDRISSGDVLRTSRDAGAVLKLDDGTSVELRERSELAVTRGMRSTTIRLDRGNVIVRATADGRVYVATPAALVTAGGTTVAVASGTKGTRVTTIEGAPTVESAGVVRVVAAGEQFASSPAITPVPAAREVAWSRDAGTYADVLAAAAALRKELDATALGGAEPRTSTRLLDLAPANTVLYVAIPNISAGLADANRLLAQRLAENPALAEWYAQSHAAGHREQLDRAIATFAELGSYVGPEIVVAMPAEPAGGPGVPVVLAEVGDASGFRAALVRQLAATPEAKVRFVDDLSAAKASAGELTIATHDGVLAASPSVDALASVWAPAQPKGAFFARLADEYREGVGFLLAADVQRIFGAAAKSAGENAALARLGVTDMKTFVVKQAADGSSGPRAVLDFDGERRGVAAWLAAPGPVGALQYVSADANVVAAFSVREPAALVDDLIGVIGAADPQALESLRRFESENGVSLRDDVAASLGGEFAFAVDGPLLPTPSWKAILEVNDPARLQAAFERTVDAVNRELAAAGKPGLTLTKSESGGRASYTITSGATSAEVHYTYADGYLVAGPSSAIVERALGYRESGYTILHAPRFVASLPQDGQTSFSALVYHDLSPVLSQMPNTMPGRDLKPTLAYAYAREDRVELGVSGEGSPLSPSSILGLPGSGGLPELLQHALKVS
jgi:hypothetical protein